MLQMTMSFTVAAPLIVLPALCDCFALAWLYCAKALTVFSIATELIVVEPSPGSMTPMRC
jgi:hypothetical protein